MSSIKEYRKREPVWYAIKYDGRNDLELITELREKVDERNSSSLFKFPCLDGYESVKGQSYHGNYKLVLRFSGFHSFKDPLGGKIEEVVLTEEQPWLVWGIDEFNNHVKPQAMKSLPWDWEEQREVL